MRKFSLFAAFFFLTAMVGAQDFEGRLVYKQVISGQETMLTVFARSQQALVQRGTEMPIYYLVTSSSPLFQAWTKGAQKSDEAKLPQLAPAKFVKSNGGEQVISGFKAKSFKLELDNGQVLQGWYAPEVGFDHNQLLARIQGAEWAQLPGKGLLLRWEVSSAKGGKVLSGELVDHQAGKQDPALFQAPKLSPR